MTIHSYSPSVGSFSVALFVLASVLASCGGSATSMPRAINAQPGSSVQIHDGSDVAINISDQDSGNCIRHGHAPLCYGLVSHINDRAPLYHSRCAPNVPQGYAPCDLWDAYNIPIPTIGCFGNACGTVAVVMWYRDPQLVNDLAQYRAASNLPACPTSTCIEELNQLGQPSPLPSNDPNGTADQEWSNDVDMVSAMCPNCHIVAVETTYPNPRSMTKVLANLTVQKIPPPICPTLRDRPWSRLTRVSVGILEMALPRHGHSRRPSTIPA